jgi:hypothetical protein
MTSLPALAVALSLVSAPATDGLPNPEPPDSLERREAGPTPNLRKDILVVGGATLLFSAVHSSVRQGILQRGSAGRILQNFRDPVGRAIEGAREDVDPFLTNYVAHPVSWALVGLYLKDRGYSNVGTLFLAQAHSIVWEYVIEGSYQKPSGKDLISNLAGTSAAVFILHPLAEHVAILNPLRPITSRLNSDRVTTRVAPDPVLGGAKVAVSLSW